MRVICHFNYSEEDYPPEDRGWGTHWFYHMLDRAGTDQSVYTSAFGDILELGRSVSLGGVCPFDIVVRFGCGSEYMYHPNGDLVKICGAGQQIIPLSLYKP